MKASTLRSSLHSGVLFSQQRLFFSIHNNPNKFYFHSTKGAAVPDVPRHMWAKTNNLKTVAAPAQQRSQVISRSEHPRAKSPGRNFFLKKVDDLF